MKKYILSAWKVGNLHKTFGIVWYILTKQISFSYWARKCKVPSTGL